MEFLKSVFAKNATPDLSRPVISALAAKTLSDHGLLIGKILEGISNLERVVYAYLVQVDLGRCPAGIPLVVCLLFQESLKRITTGMDISRK